MSTLTSEDSQAAFQAYVGDAQKRLEHDQQFPDEPKQVRPGEDIRVVDGKVQVSGMASFSTGNPLLSRCSVTLKPLDRPRRSKRTRMTRLPRRTCSPPTVSPARRSKLITWRPNFGPVTRNPLVAWPMCSPPQAGRAKHGNSSKTSRKNILLSRRTWSVSAVCGD